MKKLIFGSLIGLPLGAVLAFCYADLVCVFRGLVNHSLSNAGLDLSLLQEKDWYIMFTITFGTFLFIFLIYLKRHWIDGEREFNPFTKRSVVDLSNDKRKAQHQPVPSQFLSKQPSGFTIGTYRKRYVSLPFLDSPEHMLIIGSPGSGKSTTILNALIWNYNFEKEDNKLGAVLAIDVKPELQKKSCLNNTNNVKVINPTIFGDDNNCGFDLWYGISQKSSDDEIKERMELISRSVIPNLSGDNAHFSGNAQKILSGFLMYGFRKGLSLSDTIIKIMHVSVEDLIAEIITDPEMKNHQKIVGKVKSFDGNTSDEFASIKDTLEKDLDIFDTESVKYCFSGNPNKVTPEDLLNGTSIFLAIPDHLVTMYRTVFGLIMEVCMKYLTSIPEEKLKNKRPIWCLIDEGGTVYVPSLLDIASRGRSKKIQLSIVVQSYSQLEDLYGEKRARSIMDCCKNTIVFSCNDTRTAETISKWTGYYRETKLSFHSSGVTMLDPGSSTNQSEEYRPVMDVSDIKNLEKNNEVLAFVKGDRFLVQKAPYYTIPLLCKKSEEILKSNLSAKEAE